MHEKQKMLIDLVKESQKHDLKYGHPVVAFEVALFEWKKALEEEGNYNLEYMRSARDFIRRDNW